MTLRLPFELSETDLVAFANMMYYEKMQDLCYDEIARSLNFVTLLSPHILPFVRGIGLLPHHWRFFGGPDEKNIILSVIFNTWFRSP